MTTHSDFERFLDDWLGNTPMDPADRLVVAVAVRIRRERQRQAPRLVWGRLTMGVIARASAAAVVLVVVVGIAVGGGLPKVGGSLAPTPAPPAASSSATPVASPSPSHPPRVVGASLSGGLPDGWTVTANGLLSFGVEADGATMVIEVQPDRSVMDEGCGMRPDTRIGTTADDVVGALAARRGLVVTGDRPAEVSGLEGRQVDIALDPAVGETCPGYVPLFGRAEPEGWGFNGVSGTERIRVVALDVPGGGNVVLLIVASSEDAFNRWIGDAATILERLSLEIEP